jgi:hypothetical protein
MSIVAQESPRVDFCDLSLFCRRSSKDEEPPATVSLGGRSFAAAFEVKNTSGARVHCSKILCCFYLGFMKLPTFADCCVHMRLTTSCGMLDASLLWAVICLCGCENKTAPSLHSKWLCAGCWKRQAVHAWFMPDAVRATSRGAQKRSPRPCSSHCGVASVTVLMLSGCSCLQKDNQSAVM